MKIKSASLRCFSPVFVATTDGINHSPPSPISPPPLPSNPITGVELIAIGKGIALFWWLPLPKVAEGIVTPVMPMLVMYSELGERAGNSASQARY